MSFVNFTSTPYTGISMIIRDFLQFWYITSPKEIILYVISLNKAYFQLFSFGLLLRTFFKPLKNEYRQGLVGFSIGMGVFIKSIILLSTLVLFMPLIIAEILFLLLFFVLPLSPIYLLTV